MNSFHEDKVKIPFGSKHLDATLCIPAEASDVRTAVVLTHGAGGDMNFKHLVLLAEVLASTGLLCLRFTCKGLNLVYRVKAYNAVVEYVHNLKTFTFKNIFLGGPATAIQWIMFEEFSSLQCRSMGARAAAALVKQLSERADDSVQGLVCLSFPLHPPGQMHAHSKRSEHLLGLTQTPVLFVSGTDDDMCQRDLLEGVTKKMKAPTSVHWIEGASHGLAVKGRPEEEVLQEMNSCVTTWILEHI
ncbi:hypothetical protein SKAU_G00253120 [Synaphobranchus kaupii]|uniref:KANL3/Tex30 alpha/beta hydrolase-like domain-containing protein n=1 Tax=Synaphobranchus kaupii TaxID=118154 RepID=A0A9Q1IS35_SYNKA|nr:hypothetical protein SKAU_G00253120 [Synaphobranchus kaupii]